MKIKKDEIWDYIESPQTKLINEFPSKHDCSWATYVTEIEGKFYKFMVEYSYSNGIQFYDDYVDLTEVKPVETTEWIPV